MRNTVRGVRLGAQHELLRLRARPVTLVQHLVLPVVMLAAFGGLQPPGSGSSDGVVRASLVYTSVFAFAVLSAASTSGGMLAAEARTGQLAPLLVTPVSRAGLLLGRTVGSALGVVVQAAVLLVLAPLSGLDLRRPAAALLFPLVIVFALALSGLGLLVAGRPDQPGRSLLIQYVPMALILDAGVFIPVNDAPALVRSLALINPLTYVVDALRQTLVTAGASSLTAQQVAVVVGGHRMAVWEDVLVAVILGGPLLTVGIRRLRASCTL